MTTLLAFWPSPLDEDIDQFKVYRSADGSDPWVQIVTLSSRDGYSNWITHYVDTNATTGAYYRAEYIKEGALITTSDPIAGETPYEVTPQYILDFIQGLPQNNVSAQLIQRIIGHAVEIFELNSRLRISEQTALKEVHDWQVFDKVIGGKVGLKIQLRHWPVNSVDAVYYQVRGGANGSSNIQEFTDLDIKIEGGNGVDGYNRGNISIIPRQLSLSGVYTAMSLYHYPRSMVNILFDYTYGFDHWPLGVNELITKLAAAGTMEIAGEAETAGLSSRSVDGYSESYTASATTTIFSARRIWYEDTVKKITKQYRKPLWG